MTLVHQVEEDDATGGEEMAVERPRRPGGPADRPLTGQRRPRATPARRAAALRQARADSPGRHEPVTVNAVRIGPLLRVTGLVALGAFVALVVGGLGAWLVARGTGRIGALESFLAEAFGVEAFSFPSGAILGAWVAFSAAALAVAATVFVLLALMYNRIAATVGGIEVEVGSRAAQRGA